MPSKTHGERIDRLEQVVEILAEDQLSLHKLIAELATETRRGFDRVAEQFTETDRGMRELQERMRETDERLRQTGEHLRQTEALMRESNRALDERISKLVIAIGELIRTQNPARG